MQFVGFAHQAPATPAVPYDPYPPTHRRPLTLAGALAAFKPSRPSAPLLPAAPQHLGHAAAPRHPSPAALWPAAVGRRKRAGSATPAVRVRAVRHGG